MQRSLLSCEVVSNSFATPWTVARPAPLSMGFSRQQHWRGLPFPSPGDLLDPGTEPLSPAWQVGSLPLSHLGSPRRLLVMSKVTHEFNNVILWRISLAGLSDFLQLISAVEATASEAEKMSVG